MRGYTIGSLVCGLTVSVAAIAEGYYPQGGGPGSINWPPPGGSAAEQRPAPAYATPANKGFRPYPSYQQPQQYRYQPPQKYKNELISPPGADWPNAGYYESSDQQPAAEQPLRPVERGAPVEVIPPPSIPIEEVKLPLSNKPERSWRPMKEQEELEAMEESVAPPEPERDKPMVMREIPEPKSPLHAPEEKPAPQAGIDAASGVEPKNPTPESPIPRQRNDGSFVSGMSIVPGQGNKMPDQPPPAAGKQ